MDRDVAAADSVHRFQIEPAGIVRSVAHHDNGADGQRGRLRHHLLQTFANPRGVEVALQHVDLLHPLNVVTKAVQPHLELLLQLIEQTAR